MLEMGKLTRRAFLRRTLLGTLGAEACFVNLGSFLSAQEKGERIMENDKSYANSLPVAGQYDVVVAGGGLAGVGAACAAGRAGARTALIEAQAFAGGVATATMEATMCNHFHNASNSHSLGSYFPSK